MFNSVFKIVYFVQFLLITAVRESHTAQVRTLKTVLDRKTLPDRVLLGLAGMGMLTPLVYVFSSVLDFADYALPTWLGYVGIVLFSLAICLLWCSHAKLGRNWTPTPGIRNDHSLVTDGVYKYIRHPMYAAHWLWAIAQVFMLHNWIAGYSFLIAIVPHYFMRVNEEEQMMLSQFGEEYRAYMEKTRRLIPRLFIRGK